MLIIGVGVIIAKSGIGFSVEVGGIELGRGGEVGFSITGVMVGGKTSVSEVVHPELIRRKRMKIRKYRSF